MEENNSVVITISFLIQFLLIDVFCSKSIDIRFRRVKWTLYILGSLLNNAANLLTAITTGLVTSLCLDCRKIVMVVPFTSTEARRAMKV